MNHAAGVDRPAIKESATQRLAEFLAGLRFEALPPAVVSRTEEAFLDWFDRALAGCGGRPVRILENFAGTMGPADGPSEILSSRRRTSPFFAALVNAAASHVMEQDDVHVGGSLHPGAVVFPAILAGAAAGVARLPGLDASKVPHARWALPELRPRGLGSFCARRQTRSLYMRRKPQRTGCFPPPSPGTASPARGRFYKAKTAWPLGWLAPDTAQIPRS